MSNIYEKQSVTEVSSAQMGQMGNPLVQQGRELKSQASNTISDARRRYEKQLSNSASVSMQEAMDTFGSDPERLSKELSNLRTSMSSEIADDSVKVDFLSNFDLTSQSYISKAKHNRKMIERDETKKTITESLIDADDMGAMAFQNLLSDTSTEDDYVNYMRSLEERNALIDSKYEDGSNVYTPAEARNYKNQISKTNAYATQKYMLTLPPDEQVSFAKRVLDNTATAGQKRKLSEVLSEKDWMDLQSDARTIVNRYNKEMEREERNGRKNEEANKIAIQVLNKREFDQAYDNLAGKKKDFDGVKMEDMFNYRNNLTSEKAKGNLTDKDYKELMLKTATPIMDMIEKDRDGRDDMFIFTSPNNRQVAFNTIDSALKQSGIQNKNVIVKLYSDAYNKLIEKGFDPNSSTSETRAQSIEIANKVYQDYLEGYMPGMSDKEVAKVLIGEDVIEAKKQEPKTTSKIKYKIMTDKQGNKYKVYADNQGNFTDESVKLWIPSSEGNKVREVANEVQNEGLWTRLTKLWS